MAMRIERQYPYIVAGLPDVQLGQTTLSVKLPALLRQTLEELHPTDAGQLRALFWPHDHENLVNALLKAKAAPHPLANLDPEALRAALADDDPALPSYLRDFHADFVAGSVPASRLALQHALATRFYAYVQEQAWGLPRKWHDFDRDLRNILAAIAARRHHDGHEWLLVGHNDVAERLRSSHAQDFGLGTDFPFIDHLLRLHAQQEFVDMERHIDLVRWQAIEDMAAASYFNIDAIAARFLQLAIAERWARLDPQAGSQRFEAKIETLGRSFQFAKEFSL